MRITGITTSVVDHARGRWRFVHVDTAEGVSGCGESSVGRGTFDAVLVLQIERLRDRLVGRDVGSIAAAVGPVQVNVWPEGAGYAAAVSGVEQALWDIRGKQLGAPVATLFGGARRPSVTAYINLNHGMAADRQAPADFGARAAKIAALGVKAVKCAPFEDVPLGAWEDRTVRVAIERGLARVSAVLLAVGDGIDVMVDCHWRFTARTAQHAVRALQALGVAWIEGAMAETDLDGWRRLRDSTDARLAAGETLATIQDFHAFALASRVDVLQADVKYVGGIAPMHQIAQMADSLGMEFSPHNQAGPVQTLAGLHSLVTLPNVKVTELSLAAPDLRKALLGGAERLEAGEVMLPDAPGLGFTFDHAALRSGTP